MLLAYYQGAGAQSAALKKEVTSTKLLQLVHLQIMDENLSS